MDVRPASTSSPRSRSASMIGCSTSSVVRPANSPYSAVKRPASSIGNEHMQPVDTGQLEVLRPRARRDMHDPRPLVEGDVIPGDHTVHDPFETAADRRTAPRTRARRDRPATTSTKWSSGYARRRPSSPLRASVVRVGPDCGGDVGRQRPGRRRPDDQRLAVPAFEREADEERRMVDCSLYTRPRTARAARSTSRSAGTRASSGVPW